MSLIKTIKEMDELIQVVGVGKFKPEQIRKEISELTKLIAVAVRNNDWKTAKKHSADLKAWVDAGAKCD